MQIVIMSAKDTWSTKETSVPVKQTEKAEYANKSFQNHMFQFQIFELLVAIVVVCR